MNRNSYLLTLLLIAVFGIAAHLAAQTALQALGAEGGWWTSSTDHHFYQLTFSATGGTQPYTWSATGFPAGLQLNAQTGKLSGTISSPEGVYNLSATVMDAAGATSTVKGQMEVCGKLMDKFGDTLHSCDGFGH